MPKKRTTREMDNYLSLWLTMSDHCSRIACEELWLDDDLVWC